MSIESKSFLSKRDVAIITAATIAISAPVAVLAAREIPSYNKRRKEDQRLARYEYERVGELLEDNRNSGDSGIGFTRESQK